MGGKQGRTPEGLRAEFMRQTTHASKHNSTGPLSDAGPYDYDLPLVKGGAAQPAPASRPARKAHGHAWPGTLVTILATVGAMVLNQSSGWPLLHCYFIAYCVSTVFSYWDTPQPRQGFLRWTLKVVGLFLNFFVALVTVPRSLRGLLPDSLALALPTFAFLVIFYWVPPLVPLNGRTHPLWRWLLLAAGFAAFWGWLGTGLGR